MLNTFIFVVYPVLSYICCSSFELVVKCRELSTCKGKKQSSQNTWQTSKITIKMVLFLFIWKSPKTYTVHRLYAATFYWC